jgi:hypothetical protein
METGRNSLGSRDSKDSTQRRPLRTDNISANSEEEEIDLIDHNLITRIETVKKEKKGKERKMQKMKEDYQKAGTMERLENYDKKALYE